MDMTVTSFSTRLKELLELRQLSLRDVALALQLSRTAVHKWTHGGSIDIANLRRLAEFLQVNWLWLGFGDEANADVLPATSPLPMTDVRRQMTAEIVSNEARMKLAQKLANIVTWEWNLLTDEVFYSDNCAQLYGRVIRCNRDFWAILYPDDRDQLLASIDKALHSAEPYQHDFRIVMPDGAIRWIESRTDLVCDDRKRPQRMMGVTIDISARKEREMQQTQRLNLIEPVLQSLDCGWRQWSLDNENLSLSPHLLKAFGLPASTALSKQHYTALVIDIDRDRLQQAVDKISAGANHLQLSYRLRRPDSAAIIRVDEHMCRSDDARYITSVLKLNQSTRF